MGIALLRRVRKCTARYNHVLLFLSREELDHYVTSNKWIRMRESQRKTKGGLAIYYQCTSEKRRGGRCRHKMIAIQRPEGCFVAKTTDGGAPHNHKLRPSQTIRQRHSEPSPEASQPSSQEESTLANEFQTACSLEELKSSEQLITATPAENEQFDRTYVLQWNENGVESKRWDEAVTRRREETIHVSKPIKSMQFKRRYSLQTPYLLPAEKSFRTSTMNQSENNLKCSVLQGLATSSPSHTAPFIPHSYPTPVQRLSSNKSISSFSGSRRSLQQNNSHIHQRRRHSWSADLFKKSPRDLLRKLKAMRDQQIRCKEDDLDKIAVELFTKMDCRRQSELLAICCGN